MQRALYIYDTADLYLLLSRRLAVLRVAHDPFQGYTERQLITLWVRHHLSEDLYILLVPHAIDGLALGKHAGLIHNEWLIRFGELEQRLYWQVQGTPHRHPHDPCFVHLNDRRLILDYRTGPIDYSVYEAQRHT